MSVRACWLVVAVMACQVSSDRFYSACERAGLHCEDGWECARNQAICIPFGSCGNGFLDKDEVCDDGNVLDGEIDDVGVFVLDDCSHDCRSNQRCGNRVIDPGERCDLGSRNGMAGAFCDASCHILVNICGNGIVDPEAGEDCDPGAMDSSSCNSSMAGSVACSAARCGDGYVNAAAGEQCDTPGGSDSIVCNGAAAAASLRCKFALCGDGYLNRTAGEACEADVDCPAEQHCNNACMCG